MAGHLLRAGHQVTVWNRSREKAMSLVDEGAQLAPSLADLGSACSLVFLCVSRTEDVEMCVWEAARSAHPGTLFVDHSTISPDGAKHLYAELKRNSFSLLDAPITGGSMGAQKGQLTVFCGGDTEDYKRALPYIKSFSKRVEHVGPSGSGQMMKMANQIAVGGALLALCESLAFAKKAGLDIELARDMIGGGAAGSWAFENYGPKILAKDWSPGFSVINQRKDFGYCGDAAQSINAAIPGTKLVDQLLSELEAEGHGEWTTAALFEIMMRMQS